MAQTSPPRADMVVKECAVGKLIEIPRVPAMQPPAGQIQVIAPGATPDEVQRLLEAGAAVVFALPPPRRQSA